MGHDTQWLWATRLTYRSWSWHRKVLHWALHGLALASWRKVQGGYACRGCAYFWRTED